MLRIMHAMLLIFKHDELNYCQIIVFIFFIYILFLNYFCLISLKICVNAFTCAYLCFAEGFVCGVEDDCVAVHCLLFCV